MTKTFSTKLEARTLELLDSFCERYHLKKSKLIEEMIEEGVKRRTETLELAESIERGLAEEKEGSLYTAGEVENLVFGKKRS